MSKASGSRMARITNCLQTILDLEPELERIDLGKGLLDEFSVLRDFLRKINTVDLNEADVARVEVATNNFLDELRLPLAELRPADKTAFRLQ